MTTSTSPPPPEPARPERPPQPEPLPPLVLPPLDNSTPVSAHIDSIRGCDQRRSRIAWEEYTRIAHVHALTLDRPPDLDTRVFDHFANTSALLAVINHIDKTHADALLNEALALVHRIPLIGRQLHDGAINQKQFQQLVTATDLIDGWPSAPDIDKHIAAELQDIGVCSTRRLRDMANRIIFTHDPDAIRRRAERARARRNATSRPRPDGMAHFGITATAEDAQLAMAAVEALIATAICPRDPRSKNERRSDAAICRIQGIALTCQCDHQDCTATSAEDGLSEQQARIIVHVICQDGSLGEDPGPTPDGGNDGPDDGDSGPGPGPGPDDNHDDRGDPPAATPDGKGSPSDSARPASQHPAPQRPAFQESQRPAFLDGYGVITADHLRDIAARPDAIIRPLNPHPGHTLPTHLPSDPYRFSTALDTFIRARDGYCVIPGCNRPAWICDLDHVDEFNHQHPAAGGQTSEINSNAKCRHHHLFKTFGEWLDDQYVDAAGRTHVTVTSPHGITVDMCGHTQEKLFPALRTIRFQKPPARGPSAPPPAADPDAPDGDGPQRPRTRTADKHARRRREREINRRLRILHGLAPPPEDRI